jgi:hypothetical protein
MFRRRLDCQQYFCGDWCDDFRDYRHDDFRNYWDDFRNYRYDDFDICRDFGNRSLRSKHEHGVGWFR